MNSFVGRGTLFGDKNASVFSQAANPYFRADYLTGDETDIEAGFAILLVLNGSGTMVLSNAERIDVTRGDALVVPYSAGSWKLRGASGVVSRPPLANLATGAN